jgi:hypothetical protein
VSGGEEETSKLHTGKNDNKIDSIRRDEDEPGTS